MAKVSSPPITSPYAPDVEEVRAWLKKMIAALKFVELVTAIVTFIGRMCAINTELTVQLVNLRRKRPKSESLRRIGGQLVLPLDVVSYVAPPVVGSEPEKGNRPKRSQRGKHPGRHGDWPSWIPRVTRFNPVPADLRTCAICGQEMTPVGHSSCVRISMIPARAIIEERLDERVACPNDDTIVSAPTPPAIVEGGVLGDALILEALCDKYLDHMPIERQCSRWQTYGIKIAPSTLGRGVSTAIDLLGPVAEAIADRTRGPGHLAMDASGIPVLDPKAPDGIRFGTIWCWTNARWVTFDYKPKGDSAGVQRFLGEKNLARSVQCDGTSVTTFIERKGGSRPGCWSHGRRRLAEAARSGDKLALEGLRIISKLFAVERLSTIAGDNAEQRRARRKEHSRPVIQELRQWLDDRRGVIPPKTPLGKGLGYLHRQWSRLLLFLDDGNIEATNNRRERELRRLVLGRKNWLFTWLDDGAERTANILTIVATAISHEVNPRAYLHLVTRLIVNGWPRAHIRDLLPDRILAAHPELFVGDPALSPSPSSEVRALSP
jgi:transposase